MSFGADAPQPVSTPKEPPARGLLRRLPLIIVLANAAYAAFVTVQSLAGAGHNTGSTAINGALLLLLVLLPTNLLRFGWWSRRGWVRFLARLRKPLGISAGIWFVAHSVVGTVEYLDLSWNALPGELWIGDMAIGVLATLVFVALLLTSTDAAQRALGRNWKRLQRLVWFAVPLALVHTALSSARLHHLEPPGILLFGIVIGFAAFERYALRRRRSTAWVHAGLVVAGFAAAVLIYAASWATIGPWDLTNDAPPGPLPGTEEARPVDTS